MAKAGADAKGMLCTNAPVVPAATKKLESILGILGAAAGVFVLFGSFDS